MPNHTAVTTPTKAKPIRTPTKMARDEDAAQQPFPPASQFSPVFDSPDVGGAGKPGLLTARGAASPASASSAAAAAASPPTAARGMAPKERIDVVRSLVPSLLRARSLREMLRADGQQDPARAMVDAARETPRAAPAAVTVLFSSHDHGLGIEFARSEDDLARVVGFAEGGLGAQHSARIPVGAVLVGVQAASIEGLAAEAALAVLDANCNARPLALTFDVGAAGPSPNLAATQQKLLFQNETPEPPQREELPEQPQQQPEQPAEPEPTQPETCEEATADWTSSPSEEETREVQIAPAEEAVAQARVNYVESSWREWAATRIQASERRRQAQRRWNMCRRHAAATFIQARVRGGRDRALAQALWQAERLLRRQQETLREWDSRASEQEDDAAAGEAEPAQDESIPEEIVDNEKIDDEPSKTGDDAPPAEGQRTDAERKEDTRAVADGRKRHQPSAARREQMRLHLEFETQKQAQHNLHRILMDELRLRGRDALNTENAAEGERKLTLTLPEDSAAAATPEPEPCTSPATSTSTSSSTSPTSPTPPPGGFSRPIPSGRERVIRMPRTVQPTPDAARQEQGSGTPVTAPTSGSADSAQSNEVPTAKLIALIREDGRAFEARMSQGQQPNAKQLAGFLRSLVSRVKSLISAGESPPNVAEMAREMFASIAWDVEANQPAPGSRVAAAAEVLQMLKALVHKLLGPKPAAAAAAPAQTQPHQSTPRPEPVPNEAGQQMPPMMCSSDELVKREANLIRRFGCSSDTATDALRRFGGHAGQAGLWLQEQQEQEEQEQQQAQQERNPQVKQQMQQSQQKQRLPLSSLGQQQQQQRQRASPTAQRQRLHNAARPRSADAALRARANSQGDTQLPGLAGGGNAAMVDNSPRGRPSMARGGPGPAVLTPRGITGIMGIEQQQRRQRQRPASASAMPSSTARQPGGLSLPSPTSTMPQQQQQQQQQQRQRQPAPGALPIAPAPARRPAQGLAAARSGRFLQHV